MKKAWRSLSNAGVDLAAVLFRTTIPAQLLSEISSGGRLRLEQIGTGDIRIELRVCGKTIAVAGLERKDGLLFLKIEKILQPGESGEKREWKVLVGDLEAGGLEKPLS